MSPSGQINQSSLQITLASRPAEHQTAARRTQYCSVHNQASAALTGFNRKTTKKAGVGYGTNVG